MVGYFEQFKLLSIILHNYFSTKSIHSNSPWLARNQAPVPENILYRLSTEGRRTHQDGILMFPWIYIWCGAKCSRDPDTRRWVSEFGHHLLSKTGSWFLVKKAVWVSSRPPLSRVPLIFCLQILTRRKFTSVSPTLHQRTEPCYK